MSSQETKVKEKEPKTIPLAGCVILDDEGKVLLLHRNKKNKRVEGEILRQWELPGGKVDQGETPDITAVREVKEELGVDVELVGDGPLDTDDFEEYGGTLEYIWYQARIIEGEPAVNEDGFDELRYFSWDEIREMEDQLSLNMRNLLRTHDEGRLHLESTQH